MAKLELLVLLHFSLRGEHNVSHDGYTRPACKHEALLKEYDIPSDRPCTYCHEAARNYRPIPRDSFYKWYENCTFVENCNFGGVYLEKATFLKVTAKNALLVNSNCAEARFEESDFRAADFTRSDCKKAKFTACKLQGAKFITSKLLEVTFKDCDLSGADFTDASLYRVRYIKTNLTGVKFKEGVVRDYLGGRFGVHSWTAVRLEDGTVIVFTAGTDLSGGIYSLDQWAKFKKERHSETCDSPSLFGALAYIFEVIVAGAWPAR